MRQVFVAVLVGALAAGAAAGGATFQGKSAEDWATRLSSPDPATKVAARRALRDGGADAAPVLAELFGSGDDRVSSDAELLLWTLESEAKTVLPELVRIHARGARDAGTIVDQMGDVSRELAALARSDDEDTSLGALRLLVRANRRALPPGELAKIAARAPPREEDLVADALRAAVENDELGSPEDWRAAFAIPSLRRLVLERAAARKGPADPMAELALAALDDGDPDVRAAAAYAVATVGVPRDRAVAALRRVLVSPDREPERAALDVFRELTADHPRERVPVFAAIVLRQSGEAAKSAAEALGRMGEVAAPAAPALRAAAERDDPGLRVAATGALARLGAAGREQLVRLGRSSDIESRVLAAQGLGDGGVFSLPWLLELLENEAARVRAVAADALGRLGGDAASAVDALVARVKSDEDLVVRAKAALALGEIGARAREALPALDAIAEDDDYRVAAAAMKAAAKIRRAPTLAALAGDDPAPPRLRISGSAAWEEEANRIVLRLDVDPNATPAGTTPRATLVVAPALAHAAPLLVPLQHFAGTRAWPRLYLGGRTADGSIAALPFFVSPPVEREFHRLGWTLTPRDLVGGAGTPGVFELRIERKDGEVIWRWGHVHFEDLDGGRRFAGGEVRLPAAEVLDGGNGPLLPALAASLRERFEALGESHAMVLVEMDGDARIVDLLRAVECAEGDPAVHFHMARFKSPPRERAPGPGEIGADLLRDDEVLSGPTSDLPIAVTGAASSHRVRVPGRRYRTGGEIRIPGPFPPRIRIRAGRTAAWSDCLGVIERARADGIPVDLVFAPEDPWFRSERVLTLPPAPQAEGEGIRLEIPAAASAEEAWRAILRAVAAGATAIEFATP